MAKKSPKKKLPRTSDPEIESPEIEDSSMEMESEGENEYEEEGEGSEEGEEESEEKEKLSKAQVTRLFTAIEDSLKRLEGPRKSRTTAIKHYVGHNYADDGEDDYTPLNLLELTVQTYSRQLMPGTPRAMVTTPFMAIKPLANKLEIAMNMLIDEIRLEQTLRQTVKNGLFAPGILKIALNESEMEIGGELHDVGQPFCNVVDLDDLVVDMNAKDWNSVTFIGDMYRMPLDDVKECGLFDEEVTKDLKATPRPLYNNMGDDRAANISRGTDTFNEEFIEHITLLDLYLPNSNKVVTIAMDDDMSPSGYRLLREDEWSGPEGGPYHVLIFDEVPGQMWPLSPVSTWLDMSLLLADSYRKLSRQATRQKTVTLVQKGAENDAVAIRDAQDGEMVGVDAPEKVNQVSYGGVSPEGHAFNVDLRNVASWAFGNLDALGGLSPQADTLGQDQMLKESASRRIADMRDRVVSFVRGVMNALAWHLWHDPVVTIPMVKRSGNIDIPVRFTPEDREGDFLQFNINIQPYSMQENSPAQRVAAISQLMQQIIMPSLPFMEAQGISLDFQGLLRVYAKYLNIDELEEFLKFANPAPTREPVGVPSGAMAREMGPPRMPANTKRTYERVSRPAATNQGKNTAMIQNLLGAARGRNPQTPGMRSTLMPGGTA